MLEPGMLPAIKNSRQLLRSPAQYYLSLLAREVYGDTAGNISISLQGQHPIFIHHLHEGWGVPYLVRTICQSRMFLARKAPAQDNRLNHFTLPSCIRFTPLVPRVFLYLLRYIQVSPSVIRRASSVCAA
jgi:hypothetical protein